MDYYAVTTYAFLSSTYMDKDRRLTIGLLGQAVDVRITAGDANVSHSLGLVEDMCTLMR